MALQPLWDWTVDVPFTREFPAVVNEETMIVICGRVPEDAKHFIINFQKGVNAEAIPFHFAPCFDGGKEKVRYSSQKANNWAPMSEKCIETDMRGKNFKLTVLFWKNCYQASINGNHILIHEKNDPDFMVNAVNIYGNVKVDSLRAYDLRCVKTGGR